MVVVVCVVGWGVVCGVFWFCFGGVVFSLKKTKKRPSTLFYNLYLYQNAFKYFHMGYASTMAWVLFIIVLGLTLLIFRSSDTWVYYEGQLKGR